MFVVGFASTVALVATAACLVSIVLIVNDINDLRDDVLSTMDEFKVSSFMTKTLASVDGKRFCRWSPTTHGLTSSLCTLIPQETARLRLRSRLCWDVANGTPSSTSISATVGRYRNTVHLDLRDRQENLEGPARTEKTVKTVVQE